MKPKIAVKWEIIDTVFIRKHFPVMTWSELLDAVNAIRPASGRVGLSALRHQVKRMGLTKGIQIRWSEQDICFLQKNYTKIGNVEMAEILTKKRRTFRITDGKKVYRIFTKKHIEKKMVLLGLSRTPEQILAVKRRNLTTTNFRVLTSEDNLWTRGIIKASEEETVKIWRGKKWIKINGKFTPYTRWFYRNFIGHVPEGWIVYHLDCDILNDEPDNLACSPRAGWHSSERYRNALSLLAAREERISQQLPTMNYDKKRSEIRQMHTDLNRIRKLQQNIKLKLKKRIKNENITN